MFGDVFGYIARGNAKLIGKTMMIYVVLIIAYLISNLPNLAAFLLPSVREYYAETGSVLIAMVQGDTDAINNYRKSDTDTNTGYKSQGQQLAEAYEAQNKASETRMISNSLNIIKFGYSFVITNILTIGICSIFIGLGKRNVTIGDMFSGFTSGNYFNKLLATGLKSLAISAGFAFCIVPGIYLTYTLFMIEYLLAEDPKLSFTRAFEISFKGTSGFRLKALLIDAIFFIPTLLGMIVGIGYIKLMVTDNFAAAVMPLLAIALITLLVNMLLKPSHHSAISEVYEEAKQYAKSYGIIRDPELFDPSEHMDEGPQMTYFCG